MTPDELEVAAYAICQHKPWPFKVDAFDAQCATCGRAKSSLLLARQEIETLKGEAGREYWRGFAQAKYNRPGTLSTAEDLIRTARELAELKAEHERVTAERDRAERQLVILMGQLEAAESQLQILRAQHQQVIEKWREKRDDGRWNSFTRIAFGACVNDLSALHPPREEKQA